MVGQAEAADDRHQEHRACGATDESITRSHEATGRGQRTLPGNLQIFVSSCEKNVPRTPCDMGSWVAADVIGAAQRLCAICG